MNLKTIRDVDVKNKTVLVRVDYNVPIKNGEVESDLRISSSLPTIQFLLDGGAKKVVLISHLGRPEGKENPEFSLKPAVECLRALLPGPEIGFFEIKKGQHLADLSNCRVALLENLRFDPREEANDTEFAKEIVEFTGAEIFVQDGFAVAHRAHASTDAITKLLPSYAGLLLEKEINGLSKVIDDPERPLLMIIGAHFHSPCTHSHRAFRKLTLLFCPGIEMPLSEIVKEVILMRLNIGIQLRNYGMSPVHIGKTRFCHDIYCILFGYHLFAQHIYVVIIAAYGVHLSALRPVKRLGPHIFVQLGRKALTVKGDAVFYLVEVLRCSFKSYILGKVSAL